MSQSYPPGGYGPPPVYAPPSGPPPGYAPVPAFGTPPPYGTPPPKKPTNWPLIIGLGCGGLLVLGGLVGALIGVGFYMTARKSEPPPAAPSVAIDEPASAPKPATGGGAPKAELRDVRTWRSETIGFRHFIGEIVNTGTDPIGMPHAKITLLDASGTAIESGSCFTLVRLLEPGSKVPCTVVVTSKVDRFVSWRAEIEGLPTGGADHLADLKATEIKYTPKKGYSPASLDGKITNNSPFKARAVTAVVSLYDANEKICAAQNAVVAGGDLEAGASALFSAKVFDYAAPPATYRVRAVGYE